MNNGKNEKPLLVDTTQQKEDPFVPIKNNLQQRQKRRRKICLISILLLLLAEAGVLAVMFVCTHNINKGADGNLLLMSPVSYETIVDSYWDIKNMNGAAGSASPSGPTPGESTPVPNIPAEDQYKYYQFTLGQDGFVSSSMLAEDGVITAGIKSDSTLNSVVIPDPVQMNRVPGELKYGFLYIQNSYVSGNLDLADILSEPFKVKISRDGLPRVLVYHTHTSECYSLTEADRNDMNVTSSPDTNRNVVYTGNIFTNIMQNQFGIPTIHDITVHDTGYGDPYEKSAVTAKQVIAQNPTIQLAVDLHRDSAGLSKPPKLSPTVTKDGVDYAQIMLVVGCNQESDPNPNWRENFKLALLVLEKLEERVPGITKRGGISLRRSPYNQHVAENALLAEIGFDGNLTSEAAASAELLAEIIGEIYSA